MPLTLIKRNGCHLRKQLIILVFVKFLHDEGEFFLTLLNHVCGPDESVQRAGSGTRTVVWRSLVYITEVTVHSVLRRHVQHTCLLT
jgi:hypothetical protein